MKLLLNKRKTAAEPSQEQAPVKIAAANWTRGQQLATAATRVALWLMIACAPIALILGAVAVAAAARPAPRRALCRRWAIVPILPYTGQVLSCLCVCGFAYMCSSCTCNWILCYRSTSCTHKS